MDNCLICWLSFLLITIVLEPLKWFFTLPLIVETSVCSPFLISLTRTANCGTALSPKICDVSGHICRINAGQTLSTFRLIYYGSSLCVSSVRCVQHTQIYLLQRYLEEEFMQNYNCHFTKHFFKCNTKGDVTFLKIKVLYWHPWRFSNSRTF